MKTAYNYDLDFLFRSVFKFIEIHFFNTTILTFSLIIEKNYLKQNVHINKKIMLLPSVEPRTSHSVSEHPYRWTTNLHAVKKFVFYIHTNRLSIVQLRSNLIMFDFCFNVFHLIPLIKQHILHYNLYTKVVLYG